jgi:hypothetical protein
MKFSAASTALLVLKFQSASSATTNFYTYYEDGDLGPSNWAHLILPLNGVNQCGGTNGESGFGQSPVTIDEKTNKKCDTNMAGYDFIAGDCTWGQLDFNVLNNGKYDHCLYYYFGEEAPTNNETYFFYLFSRRHG